jgi:hypothetical protein
MGSQGILGSFPILDGALTMRGFFSQARRGGFDLGLSTGKLTRAMVEVLLQLPPGAAPSKDVVVRHLGLLGQMSKTRDINTAWNTAKRQVAREHPDRFCLDGKVLRWASDKEGRTREKLSAAGHRKLAKLAATEGTTPDELLGRLISSWRREKRGTKGSSSRTRTTRKDG